MELHSYWHQQTIEKPLFPDIEWSKPEQKSGRGKLGIIGGNKLGFVAIAESYDTALKTGAGEVRILLPDNLKKLVPPNMEVIFGASNPSGSLAKEAIVQMKALADWATGILLVGDAGRNSETAILYEDFIREYSGPLTITRDAMDLVMNSAQTLVDRPDTLFVLSFAQLQKLFQTVYYPKVLTFSMQITNLVEALHKFTVTYPVTIAVLFSGGMQTSARTDGTMVVASGGEVTTTPWDNPLQIWRGTTATRASVYWLWSPTKPLEGITASLLI